MPIMECIDAKLFYLLTISKFSDYASDVSGPSSGNKMENISRKLDPSHFHRCMKWV